MIDGVIEYQFGVFPDNRGYITTLYDDRQVKIPFKQDRISFSKKNVLRGFHGDWTTYKLISCPHGLIQLGLIDLRPESPTYLAENSFVLGVKEKTTTILVPPGVVNAHYCFVDSIFYYKWSEYYRGADNQISIHWKSSRTLKWPTADPILSDRDKNADTLQEYLQGNRL